MNVFKRQLRLSTGFSGMKKAVSTSNLTDKNFSDLESTTHNLILDNRISKTKTPSMNAQDFAEKLTTLYKSMTNRLNEDFLYDVLPTSLSIEWLTVKYTADCDMRTQKKNSAILELLSTELNYLNQMQFLLDVSEKIFSNIHQKYFSYIITDDIFLNLGEIYEVNYQFWTNYLFPSFEDAKENNKFISCSTWKDGFDQISTLFLPYQAYCSKMNQCQKYIQSLEKDKYFLQFLQWFSHTDQSNRESLSDFIAKPFQRLTKYKLLITSIYGYSDDDKEREDLTEMMNSINLFLKQVEFKLSMAHISMRMDPMDFVEPPTEDLIELCIPYRHIDLGAPINTMDGEIIRKLIKEGTFKMKEAQSKIAEVSLILFTDMILICQKIKNFEVDRIKVFRPIIPLNKLDAISPLSSSLVLRVLDDFGCLASMYLLTNDQNIINDWVEEIRNAQFFIKGVLVPKQIPENKLFHNLRINIINPSPLPGRSPTPSGMNIPGRSPTPSGMSIPGSSLNNHIGSFNRSSLNNSVSFTRSNFRSSPVIKRRLTTDNNTKRQTDDSFEFHSTNLNRALSQQYPNKSQMSILEDDDYHPLSPLDSSMSSIDLNSKDCPGLSESNEELKSIMKDEDMNGEHKVNNQCDIIFKLNDRRPSKVNEMRHYGSMINLSMES